MSDTPFADGGRDTPSGRFLPGNTAGRGIRTRPRSPGFVAADPYADCNADGQHTVADFGCFQTKFVAGCP